jgi:phytoene dehydrogenase-like protein
MARGGSQRIADALVGIIEAAGGAVECDHRVGSLAELPSSSDVMLDLTPRQLLSVLGDRAPIRYAKALRRYRYGPGVVKLDWVIDGPIPWTNPRCAEAGTVHLGGTFDEIAGAEADVVAGRHPERPYVLIAQQSLFDSTRAPDGLEAVWGYCHVPNGSTVDMTDRIEAQIERFAPGFRDRILARSTMGPAAMHAHNANYIGGDINGGAQSLRQLFTRPAVRLDPYSTPNPRLFICSSSTPPGGGVHGMGGYHAAKSVLKRSRI